MKTKVDEGELKEGGNNTNEKMKFNIKRLRKVKE